MRRIFVVKADGVGSNAHSSLSAKSYGILVENGFVETCATKSKYDVLFLNEEFRRSTKLKVCLLSWKIEQLEEVNTKRGTVLPLRT